MKFSDLNKRLRNVNYKSLIIATGALTSTSGLTWFCYQVYRTRYVLNNMFRPEALEREKPKAEYIYMLDPIYKERMMIVDVEEERMRPTTSDDVILFPSRWWQRWKHSYAWRLLSVAKTGDLSDRRRAVQRLASLQSLTASDLRQLAQVCDARTAVSLARSENVDLRFFLAPPFVHVMPNKSDLMHTFKLLITKLNEKNPHPCFEVFIKKAFPKIHRIYVPLHDDHTSQDVPNRQLLRDGDILPQCIGNLLHHSTINTNATDIVELGGLPFLMDVCRYFHDDRKVSLMLGKIISNISIDKEMLSKIFVSGWIGMLAKWAQTPDLELSTVASRALANLDKDDLLNATYYRHVYLLHPQSRKQTTIKMDIIFTHGLLGGVFFTWRQRDRGCLDKVTEEVKERFTSDVGTKEYMHRVEEANTQMWESLLQEYETVMSDCPINTDGSAKGPFTYTGAKANAICKQSQQDFQRYTQCWPKDWLPLDCPSLRIIGINYDTRLTAWSATCPIQMLKINLDNRSDDLMAKLKMAGVGERPIIWVSHSMGGLLVKNMLNRAWESKDPSARQLYDKTKAVIFYSTPHCGAPIAKQFKNSNSSIILWPSLEVQEVSEDSPQLLVLHERFLKMLEERPMRVISFAETKPTEVTTLKIQVFFVPRESANPGVGEFFEIPLNHFSICKPASRQSFLYQKVLQIIEECLGETPRVMK